MLVVNLLMPLRLDSFVLLDFSPFLHQCFKTTSFFQTVILFGVANNSSAVNCVEEFLTCHHPKYESHKNTGSACGKGAVFSSECISWPWNNVFLNY